MEDRTTHKSWNQRQGVFRKTLLEDQRFDVVLPMFFEQHAELHSAKMDISSYGSYEDDLLDSLEEKQFRCILTGEEHSIAWLLWHIARIEDVAMNVLVAGREQVINRDEWPARLNAGFHNTGNSMSTPDVIALSYSIDILSLRAYRVAVGCRTREIVSNLSPEQLKQKVDPYQIYQIEEDGSVIPEAKDLLAYWSKRTVAELLLMPATRHNFVHLNEIARLLKKKY